MGTLAPHSFKGVGTAGENTGERELVGEPDGPDIFVPELGETVGSFIDPCEHMRLPKDSGMSWLMHHVPMGKRGYYRINNFPEQYIADHGTELSQQRTDEHGFLMCTATTQQGTGCRRRAVNFAQFCQAHGGKLHPLDKVVDERRTGIINAHLGLDGSEPGNVTSEATLARMTRWQHLLSGNINVQDLDDEELARGMCRDASGGFTGVPPRMVPKDLHDRMVRELFQRADEMLKSGLMDIAASMVEIARSPAYEPADRIKAGTWIWERLRGKVADVVVHTQDKPWEMVLASISGGSRAASRAARGVADDEEILEAQLVADDGVDPGQFDPDPAATTGYQAGSPTSATPGQVVDTYGMGEVDLDDPLQNPSAGIRDDEDPLDGVTHKPDYYIPPMDPEARQNDEFDRDVAAKRARIREVELGKELAKKREAARRLRYASRAKGETDLLGGIPLIRTSKRVEDGVQHKWKSPRAPKPTRKNDEFRHRI